MERLASRSKLNYFLNGEEKSPGKIHRGFFYLGTNLDTNLLAGHDRPHFGFRVDDQLAANVHGH